MAEPHRSLAPDAKPTGSVPTGRSRPPTTPQARFRRGLRWSGWAAAGAVVLSLTALAASGSPMRPMLVITVVAGVGLSVLLAGALMGLAHLSDRTGHDAAVDARTPKEDGGERSGTEAGGDGPDGR